MSQIQSLPILNNPLYTDYDITIDSQDSNKTKRTQIGKKVKAGLSDPTITADDINQGSSKKLMTVSEQTKLTNIEPNAQVNLLERVNGQTGSGPSKNLNLTLDNIPDGVTRKAGSVAFGAGESSQLSTAYVHSQQTGNPHGTTASQVGLGQVANERQLSRTAGNFNALPVRSDIQREFNDLVPIQDDFDGDKIKAVSVGTQYIRYASHIQLWRPSVNYHADTLISSTTYEIRSIVINEGDNKLYYCLVPHQSSGSFSADLANGYWMAVAGGTGGSSPVYVIHGVTNPTQSIPGGPRTPSGAFVGQIFVNTVTGDISIRDGNDRVLNNATGGGGGGGSGIIYSLSNGTVVASTTGNRGLASTGTGADKTYETSQVIDPATGDTIDMNFGPGGTVVFDDTDINFENGTTLNYDSTVVSNHNGDTVNYDGSTINSTNTEYNHTGDTINYDATTTVDGGTFTNNTFNNPTFTGNIGLNVLYKNAELTGQGAGATYTLPSAPSGDIQVSIKGGVIQSEITPDYSHTANSTTFTMSANRTGQTVMVSYIEAVMSPSPGAVQSVTGNIVDNTDPLNPIVDQVQADWQQNNNALPDFIKNKVVRPDQLGGTTTNGKGIVRDTNGTFRDLSSSDIIALGFSTGSLSAVLDYTSNGVLTGASEIFGALHTGNTSVYIFSRQMVINKDGVYGITRSNLNDYPFAGSIQVRKNGVTIATCFGSVPGSTNLGTLLTTDDVEIWVADVLNQSTTLYSFQTRLKFDFIT